MLNALPPLSAQAHTPSQDFNYYSRNASAGTNPFLIEPSAQRHFPREPPRYPVCRGTTEQHNQLILMDLQPTRHHLFRCGASHPDSTTAEADGHWHALHAEWRDTLWACRQRRGRIRAQSHRIDLGTASGVAAAMHGGKSVVMPSFERIMDASLGKHIA